eukprot:SAG11_NODE_239_length_11783_cov_52.724923_4_plen_239_part_00
MQVCALCRNLMDCADFSRSELGRGHGARCGFCAPKPVAAAAAAPAAEPAASAAPVPVEWKLAPGSRRGGGGGGYSGELGRHWRLPSDHLPVGCALGGMPSSNRPRPHNPPPPPTGPCVSGLDATHWRAHARMRRPALMQPGNRSSPLPPPPGQAGRAGCGLCRGTCSTRGSTSAISRARGCAARCPGGCTGGARAGFPIRSPSAMRWCAAPLPRGDGLIGCEPRAMERLPGRGDGRCC